MWREGSLLEQGPTGRQPACRPLAMTRSTPAWYDKAMQTSAPMLDLADTFGFLETWLRAAPPEFRRSDGDVIYRGVIGRAQRADHPAFGRVAAHIPGHWTPAAAFGAGDTGAAPEALSVVSLAFLMNTRSVAENAAQADYPALSWYETRQQWNTFHPETARRYIAWLAARGMRAVCPPFAPGFWASLGNGRPHGSAWSERHVGWACGLGTFGLQGAFITDDGVCLRLMSFVVAAPWAAYGEPDPDPFGGCLHHRDGSCGVCADRCPSGGVTRQGRNIAACRETVGVRNGAYARNTLHLDAYACGLCMTATPCALCRPFKTTHGRTLV